MRLSNSAEGYGAVTKLLHWSIAGVIVLQYALAWSLRRIEGPALHLSVFRLHETVGLLVLTLAVARVGWRAFNRPPPLPPSVPWREAVLARSVQALFYVALIVMPLSGPPVRQPRWAWREPARAGRPAAPDRPRQASVVAGSLSPLRSGVAILGALCLHIAGALKHLVVDRDGVTTRMFPRLRRKESHNARVLEMDNA
jgi:cytochrome b561